MTVQGYIGIDAGTQGLSTVFFDESMHVVAAGECSYPMLKRRHEGEFEQQPADWEYALRRSMEALHARLKRKGQDVQIRAIGLSAQMHGEVLADSTGHPLAPARTWCDTRNEAEGEELTRLFHMKIPKRLTAARWLWSLRNRPDLARRVKHLSTPGGWLAHRLTGEWTLGIGDASGMFPIDLKTKKFDARRLSLFNRAAEGKAVPVETLLPSVRVCGEDGGTLRETAARELGLPDGIPVAPAEGDQPAAIAGSLVSEPGTVSMSFGTSVCAHVLSRRSFRGTHPGIDHFFTVDGKRFHIPWLRNGTPFMSRMVDLLNDAPQGASANAFSQIMPDVLAAPPDCGGVLALPFMDDEPGLNISRGGSALVAGWNARNATPGNIIKAALLSTMFNLKCIADVLLQQGFPRHSIVLSGGLARTPELGQILADVFDAPVTLPPGASEGSARGAALLAKYRWLSIRGKAGDWSAFLDQHKEENPLSFSPDAERVKQYAAAYERHLKLLALHPVLAEILSRP